MARSVDDRNRLLDQAMHTFWRHGYTATSVRELQAATGLGARSLYSEFGGKAALFRAALERYRERSILPFYGPLATTSPIEGLHQLIDRFESLPPDDRRRGCLVGLGMAEADEIDDEGVRHLRSLADEMHQRVAASITAGIESGEISPTTDADRVAALLVTALQGVHLTGRLDPTTTLRTQALAGAHQLIDDLRPIASREDNR